ncbi:MAG: radical SAM protein [Sandaracinaceae bacterium]|nr:radical SAM protein [Sandaracinaceae bacterium]
MRAVHEPAYVQLYESGELARRVDEAVAVLARCTVCPRDCAVNRLEDEAKVCRVGRWAKVASFFPHFGEEDCLRGVRGSGTIFFSWCNLKCVFCQNWDTSNEGAGREVRPEALASMMLELQRQGCHNINFVSPEHVVPQMLEGLLLAVERGLRLPIVYNTSAYDSLHSLSLLDGVVDIYMPDLKTLSAETSARLLKAKDYPEVATAAIREMHRQVGELALDDDGLARRGLLVRHLVMPELVHESEAVLRWLADEISPRTWVNVMDQYYPAGLVRQRPEKYPSLSRRLRTHEHLLALRHAHDAGLIRIDRRRS